MHVGDIVFVVFFCMHVNNLFPNLDDIVTLKQLNWPILCFLFLRADKQSISYLDSTATIK